MDVLTMMSQRHSVRQYLNKKIEPSKRLLIDQSVEAFNNVGGLNMKVIYDEPEAMNCSGAKLMQFENARNYIALIGKEGEDEAIGYFGEKLVFHLHILELNSCWVAGTYNAKKCPVELEEGEKLFAIIVFGYGKSHGVAHKGKKADKVLKLIGEKPEWLDKGVAATLLAPTAMNAQNFKVICDNGKVTIKSTGLAGKYNGLNLGILKCHFEMATKVTPD